MLPATCCIKLISDVLVNRFSYAALYFRVKKYNSCRGILRVGFYLGRDLNPSLAATRSRLSSRAPTGLKAGVYTANELGSFIALQILITAHSLFRALARDF
jgi:hypothetical protein